MAIKKDEAKKPKSEKKPKDLCPAGIPHEFVDYGRCIRCGEPE